MEKIATKADYDAFLEEFSKAVSEKFPGVCFYTYGSIVRGDCVYGRSDIDGGLILDSGVVTNKQDVVGLARILDRCLKEHPVRTQFNLLDRQTSRDGRFLSYTTDFSDFFKADARIVCGPDFISEMNGRNYKSGVMQKCAFGLRKVRNTLLYSLTYRPDPKKLFEKTITALETAGKYPKDLLFLKDEQLIQNPIVAQRALERAFRDFDWQPVEDINRLLGDPRGLISGMMRNKTYLEMLAQGLDVVEKLVAGYLIQFPQVSERELRE